MNKILLILFLLFATVRTFAGVCSQISRTNNTANSVLTSSKYNADHNTAYNAINFADGGCIQSGTLELDSLNTTDFQVPLNAIKEGCSLYRVSDSTMGVYPCWLAVDGTFVKTATNSTVAFGCSGCSTEAPSTQYYIYAKTSSTASSLDLLISTTAPANNGYSGTSRVLGTFYNDATSNISTFFTWNSGTGKIDDGVPPGTILPYGSEVAPPGYLIADGSAVSRETYAALFAAISTNFGTGDGSTTFNLPDLRGRFMRGWDNGTGTDPNAGTRTNPYGGPTGDHVGSIQADAFGTHSHGVTDPGHTHTFPVYTSGGATPLAMQGANSNVGAQTTDSRTTGISINNSGGSETRPKNIYVNYIVKY